jgi:hypothetical protein
VKPIYLILFSIWAHIVVAQSKIGINRIDPKATLDVNGRMKVGDEPNSSQPEQGSIRFNGETFDFEGYDGTQWINFSPNPSEYFWPAYGDRGAIGAYYDFSPNDASQGDLFGYAVDIYGAYAVIGSPGYDGGRGRVHVLRRQPVFGFWEAVDTLYGTSSSEGFGSSVAIYGDKIVVGAPFHNNEGIIRIYNQNGNQWNYLVGFGPFLYGKDFGWDVDIYENKIIAGCPKLCDPCANPNIHFGAIYHEIDANGNLILWAPIYKVFTPTTVSRFGHAVTISNDWIAISSPFSNGTPREDSVHIYRHLGGGMVAKTQAIGTGSDHNSEFGYSISMDGPKMLIGHRKRSTIGLDVDRGESLMYYRDGTGIWQSTFNIIGQDTLGKFGHSVACSATHQIVAAFEDINGFTTYIQSLKSNNGNFQPYVSITDPQATQWDHQVNDVSVNGTYFIVGLPAGLSVNGSSGGRVYFGRIR